jgi:two-component system, sensor histidine kinase and response regulator
MTTATILVVDDLQSARETVAALLRSEPYELLFAASGAEALEAVQNRTPDTILLDVMMPDMSGYELCQRLRARAETRHTPILLITALDSKAHVAQGLDAGADDFLSKPVNGLELRARVRTMLRLNRQYGELKALLRTRDEVAAMLVHDMRSPLLGMLMHAEVLRRLPLAEQGARSIEAIREQANRLRRFVDDLLLVAKIEHEAFALTRVSVEPFALVQNVVESYRHVASARGIAIAIEEAAGSTPMPLDAALFERVVDNLLSNAVKFSPADSTITVAVEVTGGESGAPRLTLRISDQGPGVSPAERAHIFEKFAIGRRHAGAQQTGLGLAFCRAVVEAHGGSIAIDDGPGGGAMLVVTI